MKYVISILIFCVVLFFYLHINHHLYKSNDLEVFTIENPSKDKLEEICHLRQPVLFDFDNPTVKPLKLDVYRPENNFKNRPVLVLIHGGGFKTGSKNNNNYVNLSNFFASRGWVVFTINYRLANDFGSVPIEWINYVDLNSPASDKKQHKAVYPAIRDAKAALRWIVVNKVVAYFYIIFYVIIILWIIYIKCCHCFSFCIYKISGLNRLSHLRFDFTNIKSINNGRDN